MIQQFSQIKNRSKRLFSRFAGLQCWVSKIQMRFGMMPDARRKLERKNLQYELGYDVVGTANLCWPCVRERKMLMLMNVDQTPN